MGQRSAVTLVGGVIVALVATACAGDDGTSGTDDGDTADPAATAPTSEDSAEEVDPVAAASGIDEVCEAGQSEGPVRRWATSGSENVEMIQPFIDEYGIDVEFTSLQEIPQRLLADQQTGRAFSADNIEGDFVENAPILTEDFVATDVDWQALGIPEGKLTSDGWGVRVTHTARGIAYNPEKFSEDEIPDTWEELVDPKWRGRVAVDPRGEHLSQLGQDEAMGPDGSKDWFDRFYETVEPVPIQGPTNTLLAVASDQVDISMAARTDQVEEQVTLEGLPLAFKALDYIQLAANYSWVVKDSPNQNATLCFLHWWVGDEGEAERIEMWRRGNDDVPEGTNAPDGSTLIPLDSERQIEQASEFAEYIANTFAAG